MSVDRDFKMSGSLINELKSYYHAVEIQTVRQNTMSPVLKRGGAT